MMSGYWLLGLVVLFKSAADLSYKKAVHDLGFNGIKSVAKQLPKLVMDPWMWVGGIFALLNVVSWGYILQIFDLSFAFPFLSISYLVVMGLGALFFKEQLHRKQLIGLSCILVGVLFLFLEVV